MKLVVREAESAALRAELHGRSGLVTSRLGVVEAERAIRRTTAPPPAEMRAVFDTVDIVELSPSLMAQAGALTPVELRTLDAIHLATLLLLGAADLDVVTYDDRLVAAARQHGFTVVQPRSGAETPPSARNKPRAATAKSEQISATSAVGLTRLCANSVLCVISSLHLVTSPSRASMRLQQCLRCHQAMSGLRITDGRIEATPDGVSGH